MVTVVKDETQSRYRSTSRIIFNILECISRRSASGRALKTHIIQSANLKTPMAERYLSMLVNAGYIEEISGSWGERKVTYYKLTQLGTERYVWFSKIIAELYDEVET